MNIFDLNKAKFNEQRRLLVESLRKRGNIDENVLQAMLGLSREIFVNPALASRVYEDSALPINSGQTISQPYTVAFMTSLLKISKDDKVLEIGTGSGYQACLLYLLGARVFTVERIPELFESSKQIFRKLNMNINSRLADGTLGWRDFAPYDGIIVTAAAPNVPKSLIEQLQIGGRLVIPVGDKSTQIMHLITRISDNDYSEEKIDRFKFVPLIGKDGWSSGEN